MHRGGRGEARASCASPLGTPLDTDADPDADPDFYLIRIRMWIRVPKMMRIHNTRS